MFTQVLRVIGAAMEPGHEGREEPAGGWPVILEVQLPQWSPAMKAGKSIGYGARILAPMNRPQWSPAMKAGKRVP